MSSRRREEDGDHYKDLEDENVSVNAAMRHSASFYTTSHRTNYIQPPPHTYPSQFPYLANKMVRVSVSVELSLRKIYILENILCVGRYSCFR